MGYQAVMTRTEDLFVPLLSRASIANETGPALFVSIHYNSAPSAEAHGVEVFYYQSKTDENRTNASKELAALVLDQVIQNTQAKSRGIKTGNFAVIRETKMPAVLIEGGFLTNQEEMQKIKDPAYIKRIAWGIAGGIDRYLRKNDSIPK
jgi:N-acetylmuramoyl-L-alanine amidase